MKKIAIPVILELHCMGMLLYFWRMSNDPGGVHWRDYGWAVLFDCANILPLVLLSFVFFFREKQAFFDKQFLLIEAIFSLSLFLVFVLQYWGLVQHTYGYQISISGVAVTTFLIIFNSIKYEYYKN
jgi:hypothetical protein